MREDSRNLQFQYTFRIVLASLRAIDSSCMREDSVTHNFLLKICAIPTRADALRLSSPLSCTEKPALAGFNYCARERTRTSKPLRALPPQGSASTNFATRAYLKIYFVFLIPPSSAKLMYEMHNILKTLFFQVKIRHKRIF